MKIDSKYSIIVHEKEISGLSSKYVEDTPIVNSYLFGRQILLMCVT